MILASLVWVGFCVVGWIYSLSAHQKSVLSRTLIRMIVFCCASFVGSTFFSAVLFPPLLLAGKCETVYSGREICRSVCGLESRILLVGKVLH